MRKIFMTSIALLCLSFSILFFQIASCTKTVAHPTPCPPCPDPKYPVTGLWEGTYTTDQVPHDPTYISFTIYPDGTFMKRTKVVGKDEFGLTKGTWTISDNILQYRDTTISYSGGVVVNTGYMSYDSTGTMSNARWQDVAGQSYTGAYLNMKRNN